MLRYATILLTTSLSLACATAQTPPPTVASPDDAIMHSLSSHSSPFTEGLSSQLQLNPTQKAAILSAVRHESPKSASPVNFLVAVGASAPPSIELYVLPDSVLLEVPEAKIVKYTMVQNQVVLVDPTTMRVVDILRE
jgi:hypothetical protein